MSSGRSSQPSGRHSAASSSGRNESRSPERHQPSNRPAPDYNYYSGYYPDDRSRYEQDYPPYQSRHRNINYRDTTLPPHERDWPLRYRPPTNSSYESLSTRTRAAFAGHAPAAADRLNYEQQVSANYDDRRRQSSSDRALLAARLPEPTDLLDYGGGGGGNGSQQQFDLVKSEDSAVYTPRERPELEPPIPRLTDKDDWAVVFDPQIPLPPGQSAIGGSSSGGGSGKELLFRRNGVNPPGIVPLSRELSRPADPRNRINSTAGVNPAQMAAGQRNRRQRLLTTFIPVLLEMDSHWEAPEPPAAVIVSNLPASIGSHDILTYFSRHGSVYRADLLNHPVSGESLRIARLTFKPSEEEVRLASAKSGALSPERPSEQAADRRRQFKLAIAAARKAVKAENGKTLLGSVLRVDLDPFGYVLRRLIAAVAQQQQQQHYQQQQQHQQQQIRQTELPTTQTTDSRSDQRRSNSYEMDYRRGGSRYDYERPAVDQSLLTLPPTDDYHSYLLNESDTYGGFRGGGGDEYANARSRQTESRIRSLNDRPLLTIPYQSVPTGGRVNRRTLFNFIADYRPVDCWPGREAWMVEFASSTERDHCLANLNGRYLLDYRLAMYPLSLPRPSRQRSPVKLHNNDNMNDNNNNANDNNNNMNNNSKLQHSKSLSSSSAASGGGEVTNAFHSPPKRYGRRELLDSGLQLIRKQLANDFVKDLKIRLMTGWVQELVAEWLTANNNPPAAAEPHYKTEYCTDLTAAGGVVGGGSSFPTDSRRPSESTAVDANSEIVGRAAGTPPPPPQPPIAKSGLDLYLQSMSAMRKRKQAAQNSLRLKRKQLLKAMRAAAEPHPQPAAESAVDDEKCEGSAGGLSSTPLAASDSQSHLPAKKRRARSTSPKVSVVEASTAIHSPPVSNLVDTVDTAIIAQEHQEEDEQIMMEDDQPPEIISLFDVVCGAIVGGGAATDGISGAQEELAKLGLSTEPSELEDFNYLQLALDTMTGGKSPDSSTNERPAHLSGCARAEGYYVIPEAEKSKYLPHRNKALLRETISGAVQSVPMITHRENRANHRRLVTGLEGVKQQAATNSSDILKFNQLKNRKKRIKFAKSGIHDWGLFAMEHIDAQDMVIEYIGEVIRQKVADHREKAYEKVGIGSSYLFRLDDDLIIDATFSGNLARFINHSCEPNCTAKIITVDNEKKIVIYASKDIEPGEEITYDYKFPIEDEKIPCLCGAAGCRGTLN